MSEVGRQQQVSRFKLGNPREARDAKSREKPNYTETNPHNSKWGYNKHEVKANTCRSQGVPNGHPEQVGTKRTGKVRRGSEPLSWGLKKQKRQMQRQSPRSFSGLCLSSGATYNRRTKLVWAISQQESCFPWAVSPPGLHVDKWGGCSLNSN